MNVWCWLNANAGTLQSLSAPLGVVLTIVSIVVLIVTCRVIKRQAIASELQADAARAMTKVAEEQTKAAKDAAVSAKTQCDLLSSQLEMSTAPLLVVEPYDVRNISGHKLVNRGLGVAFQVLYWQGGLEKKNQKDVPLSIATVEPSTLAPGSCAYVSIPPDCESWTVQYRGIDRQDRWTIVHRDKSMPQKHVIQKGLQEIYLA